MSQIEMLSGYQGVLEVNMHLQNNLKETIKNNYCRGVNDVW